MTILRGSNGERSTALSVGAYPSSRTVTFWVPTGRLSRTKSPLGRVTAVRVVPSTWTRAPTSGWLLLLITLPVRRAVPMILGAVRREVSLDDVVATSADEAML